MGLKKILKLPNRKTLTWQHFTSKSSTLRTYWHSNTNNRACMCCRLQYPLKECNGSDFADLYHQATIFLIHTDPGCQGIPSALCCLDKGRQVAHHQYNGKAQYHNE